MTTRSDTQRVAAAGRAHYLHPFTDHKALAAHGARIITRAEGVYIYTSDGEQDPRRHVRPVVRDARLRPQGTGRRRLTGRCSSCRTTTASSRARTPPAIELARILTEVTPPQFNHVFYTGSGSEANDTMIRLVRRYWQLLGPARAQRDHFALERISRQHHGRRVARRHEAHARAARAGRPMPGIVHINQPYWFGEGGDLTPAEFGLARARELEEKILEIGPGARRGLHRRAGAGRRRPGHPAGHLLARDPAHRRQVRHPAGLRRGDLRLRPHRAVVRLRALRHPAGFHDHGQGPVIGYLPIGGVMVGDRVADVLIEQGRRVLSRFHLFRPSGRLRGRDRQPRDLPARTHRRAGPRRGRPLSSTAAGASWPLIRWSARRAAWACWRAIELVPDKSSRRFFEPRGEVGMHMRDNCTRNGLVMRATRDTLFIAPPLVISRDRNRRTTVQSSAVPGRNRGVGARRGLAIDAVAVI